MLRCHVARGCRQLTLPSDLHPAGRWKATSVAVKIIEHRTGGNSSGKGKSAGQEELLATSASHPNVVSLCGYACPAIQRGYQHAQR